MMKFDRDPLDTAEGMMAKVDHMAKQQEPRVLEGQNAYQVANDQREAVRDLLLLSIAQSLRTLAENSNYDRKH